MMDHIGNLWVRISGAACLTILLLGATGCTSFGRISKDMPVEQEMQGQYAVEMHSRFARAKVNPMPVTENLTVQTALEQNGATSQFRNMEIDLYRKTPEGRMLKMPIEWDAKMTT